MPAEGTDRREGRDPRIAEVAGHQLGLDLEADDEEEQRHQRIVDEGFEGLVEDVPVTDDEIDVGLPEVVVGLSELAGQVGPDQGRRGGDEQKDARGGLLGQESHHRPGHRFGQATVAPAPRLSAYLYGRF